MQEAGRLTGLAEGERGARSVCRDVRRGCRGEEGGEPAQERGAPVPVRS